MKKSILIGGALAAVLLVLSGCVTYDRDRDCPTCSDEQWRKLTAPTPAEKAESRANYQALLAKQKAEREANSNRKNLRIAAEAKMSKRIDNCIEDLNPGKPKDDAMSGILRTSMCSRNRILNSGGRY